MAKAVYDELLKESPKNGFTVGINDDVTFTSLACDESYKLDETGMAGASSSVLGADGTVGANKNTIKIIGRTRTCLRRVILCTIRKNQAPGRFLICVSDPNRSVLPI